MEDIEIIRDIRLVPGTLDLIVVRQKVSATGGEMQLVGAPSESTISLSGQKAKLTLSSSFNKELGYVLVAHVKNLGLSLLHDMKIILEVKHKGPPQPGVPEELRQTSTGFGFYQANREIVGPIVPGETRDYFLHGDFFEMAARAARAAPTEKIAVIAKAGEDEVGRVGGNDLKPFLNIPCEARKARVDRRVRDAMNALSPDDKKSAQKAINSLNEEDPANWQNATPMPGNVNLYLLRISPELVLVVRRNEPTNNIDVVDLLGNEVLEGVVAGNGFAGS